MKRDINEFYWSKFYDDNLKSEIEEKGEAYMEWLTCKSSMVKQLNYLRSKHKLHITWFEKYNGCYCIFFREPILYRD